MSKKDRIKSLLDFYKALFIAILIALFGVCGFLVIHRSSLEFTDFVIFACGISFLLVVLVCLLLLFFKLLKSLEDL